MEDVLDLYEKPLDPTEPVVCLDEKPVQLTSDTRDPIPMKADTPKLYDYEYKRKGTGNVFCVIEPKAGKHMCYATKRRTGKDFAVLLKQICDEYPSVKTIHLVMDNLSTHGESSLTNTFGDERGSEIWKRFTPHYTPTHGSWLNQAEIECSMLAKECLGRNRIPNLTDLVLRTKIWNETMNRNHVTIDWRFTTQKARKKFHYRPSRRKLQSLPQGSDKVQRAKD